VIVAWHEVPGVAPPKEPSRRVRYDSSGCAHRSDDCSDDIEHRNRIRHISDSLLAQRIAEEVKRDALRTVGKPSRLALGKGPVNTTPGHHTHKPRTKDDDEDDWSSQCEGRPW